MNKRQKIIVSILALLVVCTSIFALSVGAYQIPVSDVVYALLSKFGLSTVNFIDPQSIDVVYTIRLPRIFLGILVGAALGISGAGIQGVFRNPLADSTLIGLSSGAALFAVFVIAVETYLFVELSAILGYYLLIIAAFIGAVCTAIVVYCLSLQSGKPNITTMLLAGIAVNAFTTALTGLITYMATDQQLRNITFWMLGSLAGANWDVIQSIAPFIIMSIIGILTFGKALNAFALGEAQAGFLGINTNRVKTGVVVLSTLAVGCSVAVSGIIGFVGLLVPHITRLLGGTNNRYVLIGATLMGAFLLLLADVLSRILLAPMELPIGIITALFGTPVFIYILLDSKK